MSGDSPQLTNGDSPQLTSGENPQLMSGSSRGLGPILARAALRSTLTLTAAHPLTAITAGRGRPPSAAVLLTAGVRTSGARGIRSASLAVIRCKCQLEMRS